MVGSSKIPPKAFQDTEKVGTDTEDPPTATVLVPTFMVGSWGAGIVIDIELNADWIADTVDCAQLTEVL